MRRWLLADGPATLPTPLGEVVAFRLDLPQETREHLYCLLDAAERARAARLVADLHRDRFVVAHGRLRQLLGAALGVEPQSLEFQTGPHGKPFLAPNVTGSPLHFNLSHSGNWGLLGWSREHEIGVDIEEWRTMRDAAALVQRYFSASEIAAYQALPAAARREAFFNCWTRKEAYVKGVGRGLGLPLDSFDVSIARDDARLLRQSRDAGLQRFWTLQALPMAGEVSAAVVMEAARVHIFPVKSAD
jgi:4'-phosphopantetheinyl transferase